MAENTEASPDPAPKTRKKFHFSRFLLGLVAGTVFLVMVIIGIACWGLSQGKIDVTFAKPTLQNMVREAQAGFDLEMDNIYLEWPEFTGPVLISMDNVQLLGEGRKPILNVKSVGVDLSYRRLLLGSVRPSAIIIDEPTLKIERTANDFGISLQEYEITEQEPEKSSDKTIQQKIATTLTEVADSDFAQGTLFSNLEKFEIRQAKVVVQDYLNGMTRYFTKMNASLSRSDLGAALSVTAQLPGGKLGASSIGIDFDYSKRAGQFRLDLNLQDIDPFIFGDLLPHAHLFQDHDCIVNGQASAVFDRVLQPVSMQAELQSKEGTINLDQYYDEALAYKDANFRAVYNRQNGAITVEDLSLNINNVPIQNSISGTITPDKITIPVRVSIDEVTAKNLASLLPTKVDIGDAKEWLVQRLKDGTYKNMSVGVDIIGTKQDVVGKLGPLPQWVWSEENIKAAFDFEAMTIEYVDTLTPATKALGKGEFDGESLFIREAEAYVGEVHGTNMKMAFTDFLIKGGGVADIKMDLNGPLSSFLKYLKDEPIALGDDIGIDTERSKGTLNAKLDIQFPTIEDLPKEEVVVKVTGQLSDVDIPDIVRGLSLTGGPVDLTVEGGKVHVKGDSLLAGRAVTLDWQQYLDSTGQDFAMKVVAQIGVDKELRNHFGINLDDFVSGTLPVDLTYLEKPDGNADITLKGDVTPMVFHIDPFAYNKPSGVAGMVTLDARLKQGTLTTIKNLNLQTKGLNVKDASLDFRSLGDEEVDLSGGKLPSVTLGKTQQVVNFAVNSNNHWTVNANGSVFDAEPFLQDKAPEETPADNPSFDITLTTQTMLTKKGQSVKEVALKLGLNNKGNVEWLEMDALAGSGQILVQYRPDPAGQRNFMMTATDAGAALKAFDVFPDVRGGRISIYGEPVGGRDSDDIYGTARMENFRVVKAPALAQLISAMSLSGLDGALQGEGLAFEKLEGDFEWLFRPQGSLLGIQNGRTSGSSLGLTFEGNVDRAQQTIDIKGTIIPLSGINNIIGSIPLVGDILTGGSGLVAATYTMRGPATEPKVSINPLSVLTPGFLRRILFEGDSDTQGAFDKKKIPEMPKATPPVDAIPSAEKLLNAPVNE